MTQTDSPTVVVINDERNIRSLLANALEQQGLSVAAFQRGADALDDPRLANAELIIADWTNRPKGSELWQTLRASKHRAKVMFVSPHADDIEALFVDADEKPAAIIGVFITRKVVAQALALLGLPASADTSLS